MSRWEAPRIAYELAVEWAERMKEKSAVGSGDAHGRLHTDERWLVGKAWHDLRTLERHDVLAALGAQARSALWETRKHHGLSEGQPIIVDVQYYSDKLCEQARETMRALASPDGNEPWALPECSHCADWVATALIDLEVNAILATGITDPAAVLRMLLGSTELPAQREAGDDSGN